MNYIILDIETQDKIDFSNQEESIRSLRLSIAVTYNSLTNNYSVYTEDEIPQLIDELTLADEIIGVNLLAFDYPVLAKYDENVDFEGFNTIDILDELKQHLDFRVPLSNMALATLGEDKSGDGLEAISLFHNGELMELIEYCKQDVILTRKLYEYGKAKGFIKYRDNKLGVQKVTVNWNHDE